MLGRLTGPGGDIFWDKEWSDKEFFLHQFHIHTFALTLSFPHVLYPFGRRQNLLEHVLGRSTGEGGGWRGGGKHFFTIKMKGQKIKGRRPFFKKRWQGKRLCFDEKDDEQRLFTSNLTFTYFLWFTYCYLSWHIVVQSSVWNKDHKGLFWPNADKRGNNFFRRKNDRAGIYFDEKKSWGNDFFLIEKWRGRDLFEAKKISNAQHTFP